MTNPFEKRATEFLRDDEAGFLALVSPEPLRSYLADHAKRGHLLEKLIRIVGTPGSGKTTMATLLEARMVMSVLAERDKENHRDIIKVLEACGVVKKARPVVAAVRLPMEGEYRDFWELPYNEALRSKLVLALIQARAILGLFRNLERRVAATSISFITRPDSAAALSEIGGPNINAIIERAREVERAVYEVGARLVAPREDQIPDAAVRPFRPLDVIEGIQINDSDGQKLTLKPLIILDDAHNLAPRQFDAIFRDLARREIRVARWIMMRFDALTPAAVLVDSDSSLAPELKAGRDYVNVFLQKPEDRDKSRTQFRNMARSMADRYLRRHEIFEDKQWRNFSVLLSSEPDRLSPQGLKKLERDVDKASERLKIPRARRSLLEREVDRYASGARTQDLGSDIRLAMLKILLHRYAGRVPQQSLFAAQESPEPNRKLAADAGVAEAARLHLRHGANRALHFGINAISDSSCENAELFLHLSAALVDRMETRIINGDSPQLSAKWQDKILGDRARMIIENWNFPFACQVRAMVASMAKECLDESLKPNAPLDAGANAIGVLQDVFDEIPRTQDALSQVLHYSLAYNALVLRPRYRQGNKLWCLLELGGPVILAHSLTLRRGGFLERRVSDLLRYVGLDK
jgi:hypothetical protein